MDSPDKLREADGDTQREYKPETMRNNSHQRLSDLTEVHGIPWSKLKHKLADRTWDIDAFYRVLTAEDKKALAALDNAQWAQGDMGRLRQSEVSISDESLDIS